jgi:hypothetical protein
MLVKTGQVQELNFLPINAAVDLSFMPDIEAHTNAKNLRMGKFLFLLRRSTLFFFSFAPTAFCCSPIAHPAQRAGRQ